MFVLVAYVLLAVLSLAVCPARSIPAGVLAPNDRCDDATAIADVPYADSVVTTAATTEATDPTPMCPIGSPNSRGKSVWYVFDAPAAGTIVADTFDSDYDTILSAYSGACGSLQPIPNACSDDDPLDGAQSRVSFAVSPGITYRFMASAFHDDGGTLAFHAVFSAANTPSPTLAPTPAPSHTGIGTPLATATRTATASLSGDANCDGRKTAADLTAVITLIAAGGRAPCGRDDANGDGILNIADVAAIIDAIFAP